MSSVCMFACLVVILSLRTTFGQLSDRLLMYAILEESPENTFVGELKNDSNLTSSFPDVDERSFRFTIVSQGNADASNFKVDSKLGTLRVSGRVDRDAICRQMSNCSIPVDIVVHAPPSVFTVLKVTIRVIDINDNAPSFFASAVTRNIPEDTPPGTSFRIASADDADSPRYGVMRYVLSGSQIFDLKLTTSGNGVSPDVYLVMRAPLDRETRDNFRLVLTAYDGGVPSLSGNLSLTILISDVNDNRPVFGSDAYMASVYEDAPRRTFVIAVSAVDADAGANSEIAYAFSSRTVRQAGHVFGIDPTSGNITVIGELDFEQVTSYALVVTARERNVESLPVETRVTISVLDRNDNSPVISIDSLTGVGAVLVPESSAPGSFVALLSVNDPDSGTGGHFQCNLRDNKAFVSRQLYTSEFKLETAMLLDRESISEYTVIFTCIDSGYPALTSSLVISINVGDENDNTPLFEQPSYHVTVKENNAVGEILLQVNASDSDVGDNGMISYSIIGSHHLSVDPASGNITAQTQFDHENVHQRHLTAVITASDNGKPPRSATALISVTVVDVNDEAPIIAQAEYEFTVMENLPAGAQLEGRLLSASDADLPPSDEFVYELRPDVLDTSVEVAFAIDDVSGLIVTRLPLDAETRDTYVFTVIARDTHAPELTSRTRVRVRVMDENDNTPVIIYPNASTSAIRLYDRTPVGYVLPRVLAVDNDSTDDNRRLSYAIVAGNENGCFTIDPTSGEVMVSADLTSLTNSAVILLIRVEDNGSPPTPAVHANYAVNISAAPTTIAPSSLRAKRRNRTILLTVAILSCVVIMTLIAAICVVRRQERRRMRRNNLTKLFSSQKKSEDITAESDGSASGVNNKLSYENHCRGVDIAWTKRNNVTNADRSSPSSLASVHADGQKFDQYAGQLYDPRQGPQVSPIPMDGDTDSIRSNSDSGRGSNEDVQLRQNVPHPTHSGQDALISLDAKRRLAFGDSHSPGSDTNAAGTVEGRRQCGIHHDNANGTLAPIAPPEVRASSFAQIGQHNTTHAQNATRPTTVEMNNGRARNSNSQRLVTSPRRHVVTFDNTNLTDETYRIASRV